MNIWNHFVAQEQRYYIFITGMPLRFWFRRAWGAKYWRKDRKVLLEPLYHPLEYVLLYYHSYKKSCAYELTCKKVVKQMQKYHIQYKGYPDIAYNFLIAKDGVVYEGRGWVVKPEVLDERYREYNGKSLDVAYIGKFSDGVPDVMNQGVHDLIEFGIKYKYISESPKIIEIPEELIKFDYTIPKPLVKVKKGKSKIKAHILKATENSNRKNID